MTFSFNSTNQEKCCALHRLRNSIRIAITSPDSKSAHWWHGRTWNEDGLQRTPQTLKLSYQNS